MDMLQIGALVLLGGLDEALQWGGGNIFVHMVRGGRILVRAIFDNEATPHP